MILVDDYDVLTTAGQQPLAPFLPYIPSAQDIGLHFVLTRRSPVPPAACTSRCSRACASPAPRRW